MSLLYDDYLAEHIDYVNKGLHWMQDNLELNDDEKNALENAMITFNHDASKYDREEYLPYDAYFYGGNRSYRVVQDFNYAWLRHIHHNPHHWQHWVLLEDDPQTGERFKALAMPLDYIFEMIADWWSFSWKNENLGEIFTWYDSHRDKMILHKDTRRMVEDILWKIREKVVPPEEKLNFVTNSEPIGKVVNAVETENGLELEIVEHSGVKGQKWGVRRYQNYDGTLTEEGKIHYGKTVFVSGSSKTQLEGNQYYRKELPKEVKDELDRYIKGEGKILVGDAPGIDRQVQDYLNKKNYNNVEVYGPGKEVRYSANKNWKTNPIDDPDHEPGSKEWLAKKDKAMSDAADDGLAVILDEGSKATRENIRRMLLNNKDTKVFELSKNGSENDKWSVVNQLFEERRDILDKTLDQELSELVGLEILGSLGFDDDELRHSDDEEDPHQYGVPKQKKFPLPDKDHVLSAIRFFNYVDPKYEKELAKAILEKIEEYGVSLGEDITVGEENKFKKYIPEKEQDS